MMFQISLLAFVTGALAADPLNYFLFPSPYGGNKLYEGYTIDVAFTTNYTNPYLSLFCGNINQPIVFDQINLPANVHPLLLDFAPQESCYLQIQQGTGPPSTQPSFGTGIFSIIANTTAGANQSTGTVQGIDGYTIPSTLKPPQNCNCVCSANHN